MNADDLAAAADRNLACAWAALGRHAGFPVIVGSSMTLTASGLPIAFLNGAFASAPAVDPDALLRDVLAFFASRSVPYLMWVREGADDALLAAGRAAGLRDAGGPPLQVLDPLVSAPALPSDLDVVLATEHADLRAHRDVVAAGFGMPAEVASRVIGDGCLDDPDLAILIGRVDSVPVATALLAQSGDTAGVYNVATLPEHRGKGYGETITWAVVNEGARRGCTHAVLQASEAGYPVYRRMGFVDLGRYVQLAGPPDA